MSLFCIRARRACGSAVQSPPFLPPPASHPMFRFDPAAGASRSMTIQWLSKQVPSFRRAGMQIEQNSRPPRRGWNGASSLGASDARKQACRRRSGSVMYMARLDCTRVNALAWNFFFPALSPYSCNSSRSFSGISHVLAVSDCTPSLKTSRATLHCAFLTSGTPCCLTSPPSSNLHFSDLRQTAHFAAPYDTLLES